MVVNRLNRIEVNQLQLQARNRVHRTTGGAIPFRQSDHQVQIGLTGYIKLQPVVQNDQNPQKLQDLIKHQKQVRILFEMTSVTG